MRLKLTFSLVFAIFSVAAFSASADTVSGRSKIVHHFQFELGNYVSESFVSHRRDFTGQWQSQNVPVGTKSYIKYQLYSPSFIPMYSYSAGFDYKVEFTKQLGLRSGLNYFTYGYIEKGGYDGCPECASDGLNLRYFKQIIFESSLLVPIHFTVHKSLHTGRFIFSAGPDFYLPVNAFGQQIFTTSIPDVSPVESNIHYHLSAVNFLRAGSMGFSLGFGYEKILSKKVAIEISPDLHFLNLVPFDFQKQGVKIYKNYIFNFAFGLSTYLTFY